MSQGSLYELRCKSCGRLLGKARGADSKIEIQCRCKTVNTFVMATSCIETSSASAVRVAN